MPDVNEDMDELFKKAGEGYPLNTQGSDWNEVYKSIQTVPSKASGTRDKRKYLPLLLFLLAFFLVIIIYQYVIYSPSPDISEKVMRGNNDNAGRKKDTTSEVISQKAVTSGAPNKKSTAPPSEAVDTVVVGGISLKKDKVVAQKQLPFKSNIGRNKLKSNKTVETPAVNYTAFAEANANPVDQGISHAATGIDIYKYALPDEYFKKLSKPQALTELEKSLDTTQGSSNKKAPKQKNRQQRFYAGLVAGPDLSTIKFQKIIKTGVSAGIIAGYRANKNWSIESGLYVDKKYYYSEGKHFSTKKVYIPSYTKIENLDGYCLMLELPLNIKYDFKPGKKANWYALMGSTSYIMKKEDYSYRYKSYGQIMEKKLFYRNSSKNWASMLNLALGYSSKVSKTTKVRIEPYIKVPLKGIGIGEVPVTSTGLHLALTKNLF